MQDFNGKNILLGICGGVAAYKSAYLIRELTRLGASVRVVMTDSAKEFISPLLIQALSGHDVRSNVFDAEAERAMGHIELARWADYLLIAPATANCIAKLAQGLADDLLTTLYLVAEVPVFICPAMNHSMWSHPATQANYSLLKKRGIIFIGPEEGSQACGEHGYGRLSEIDSILDSLRQYKVKGLLTQKKVIITAGPTREKIDPVRYISNFSSGRMGYALASAAQMAGAEVILISGPTHLNCPLGVRRIPVESAVEMHQAVNQELQLGSIFIGCAAVADYGLTHIETSKIKKTHQDKLTLNLSKNPDILQSVANTGKASFIMGFAAETENLSENALEKLVRKKINMIAANRVGKGLGFEVQENEITLFTNDKTIELPLMHKSRLAAQMIAILAANLQNAPSLKEELS